MEAAYTRRIVLFTSISFFALVNILPGKYLIIQQFFMEPEPLAKEYAKKLLLVI